MCPCLRPNYIGVSVCRTADCRTSDQAAVAELPGKALVSQVYRTPRCVGLLDRNATKNERQCLCTVSLRAFDVVKQHKRSTIDQCLLVRPQRVQRERSYTL